MYAQDSQYVRGNENNQDPSGRIAGYVVFNVDARWNFARGWELFGMVNNLFNRKYETAGVLGLNFFNGPGNTFDATNTVKGGVPVAGGADRRVDRRAVRVRRAGGVTRWTLATPLGTSTADSSRR